MTYSPSKLITAKRDWVAAGAEAFGMDYHLAYDLFLWTRFYEDEEQATLIAAALYLLASKPDNKRDQTHFPDIREMAREAVEGA